MSLQLHYKTPTDDLHNMLTVLKVNDVTLTYITTHLRWLFQISGI